LFKIKSCEQGNKLKKNREIVGEKLPGSALSGVGGVDQCVHHFTCTFSKGREKR
jgi:hypothetical protein